MNEIFLSCKMHIDASLLNFHFNSPSYAYVKYVTYADSKLAGMYAVECNPAVLREINNMPEFLRQCEMAAKHNAETYWLEEKQLAINLGNIDPVFQKALRPYIIH